MFATFRCYCHWRAHCSPRQCLGIYPLDGLHDATWEHAIGSPTPNASGTVNGVYCIGCPGMTGILSAAPFPLQLMSDKSAESRAPTYNNGGKGTVILLMPKPVRSMPLAATCEARLRAGGPHHDAKTILQSVYCKAASRAASQVIRKRLGKQNHSKPILCREKCFLVSESLQGSRQSRAYHVFPTKVQVPVVTSIAVFGDQLDPALWDQATHYCTMTMSTQPYD